MTSVLCWAATASQVNFIFLLSTHRPVTCHISFYFLLRFLSAPPPAPWALVWTEPATWQVFQKYRIIECIGGSLGHLKFLILINIC